MWYTATLVLRAEIIGGPLGPSLHEECMVLIKAKSEEEARSKARRIGKKAEVSYKNDENGTVKWHLVEITEIYDPTVDELKDGVEIWSRYFRRDIDGRELPFLEEDEE